MSKIRLSVKEHGSFYLVQWDFGYIQVYEQFSQFFRWPEMNWLGFNLFNCELEYSKVLGPNFTLELTIFGLGLVIFHNAKDKESSDELNEWVEGLMENQRERAKIIEDLAVHKDAPAELRQRAAASIALDRKQTSEHEQLFDF